MATKNVRNVLYLPGRLAVSPTNLASDFPHGGTELGVVRDAQFRPNIRHHKIIAEEFGRPVGAVVASEEAVLMGVLRSWDDDMIRRLFHNTQVDSDGVRGILGRASLPAQQSGTAPNRAGYDRVADAVTLVYSPRAVDQHQMLVLYNAVPLVDEAAELQLSIGEEFGLAFAFMCTPDVQGRDYAWDLRANLTL